MTKISINFIVLGLFLALTNCAAEKDLATGEKILREPNVFKKIEDNAAQGKGVLKGGISGVISRDTTYNFGT